MIEKLVTSKTRIKILNLFLSNIDDRYYLRELERMLEESLSPLRRQLVKLTDMGILITEEEANLKYYRLNKNFEGLEELRKMILGRDVIAKSPEESQEIASLTSFARNDNCQTNSGAELAGVRSATPERELKSAAPKQFRYDLAILSFVSIFVLATAMFVVYTNTKNIKMVSGFVVNNQDAELAGVRSATPANNGEMISKKWKVIPGNIPVLLNEETGEDRKNKEL